MIRLSLYRIAVAALLFIATSSHAQYIDEEECLDCISQGCQYCATQGAYDANSEGSALYCECDADAAGTCLTTEAQCEIDFGQIVSAAAWLLLLPCLCACGGIACCVYLCCRNSNGAATSASGGGNYYMQDANPNKLHSAMVGTEPYSNHTYSQQQQDNYYNPANNAPPASNQPFSQALSK